MFMCFLCVSVCFLFSCVWFFVWLCLSFLFGPGAGGAGRGGGRQGRGPWPGGGWLGGEGRAGDSSKMASGDGGRFRSH